MGLDGFISTETLEPIVTSKPKKKQQPSNPEKPSEIARALTVGLVRVVLLLTYVTRVVLQMELVDYEFHFLEELARQDRRLLVLVALLDNDLDHSVEMAHVIETAKKR